MNPLFSKKLIFGAITAMALAAPVSASATPVSFNVAGTFAVGTGSLSDLLGVAFTSGFTYDTDTSLALPGSLAFAAPIGGGQELGAEFATPVGFATPAGGGGGFVSTQLIVESENNVTRSSAELLNLLPGGVYDFFGLTAFEPGTITIPATTINEGNTVVTGVSVDMVFIGDMFAADLTVADSFPATLDLGLVSHVIVLVEEYENEVLIGQAYQFGTIGEGGTFSSFTIESEAVVSEPLSIALFGLGLGVMGAMRRKRTA